MAQMKSYRLILIVLSVLMLLGCIGMTMCLLFSNYQNVRLFKQAQNNFARGDEASLSLAETQLLQLIRNDSDHEAAFIMLGEIARKKKVYPEQVYYCFMAYRLNPLNRESQERYVNSLCYARYFQRLENFLAQHPEFDEKFSGLRLYAAGRNGRINKYKARYRQDNPFCVLAFQLFKHNDDSPAKKLDVLKQLSSDDSFFKQELLAAQTELYLAEQDFPNAQKALEAAWKLNEFAFAPALGRFYSRYCTIGKALEVFEKHLSLYHDQLIALQTAELYCLLNQTDKIAQLRSDYQSDSGNRAMLCSYYFDALIALAKKDMASLKELTLPLRKNIHTPLSAFMFFCADVQGKDLAAVEESYKALLAHDNYLNLQEQADSILSGYLKKAITDKNTNQRKLLSLVTLLHSRKPEIFTAKLILLAQKRSNSVNVVLLKDSLRRFGSDRGLVKIAIEYYLKHDLNEAEKLIGSFKQQFAQKAKEMLRYEIILNLQKKDYDKVSELFRKNLAPALLPEYWSFASSTGREIDLRSLSSDKLYGPFAQAQLLLKEGKAAKACDLLEGAAAKNNYVLLFFAAKTLAENGRNKAALKKYAHFPQGSPYEIPVLLNTAEIHAEIGNPDQALLLAGRAYTQAPQMPETQLCYADKLYRAGKLKMIPEVVKLSSSTTYKRRLEPLWIAGMEQQIKECNIKNQREKIRELCRQLLVVSPDNHIAREHLKKLRRMPQ